MDNVDNHVSETELDELSVDEYNYIIYNNRSREELYEKIVDIFN